jgi:hypothetical protein
MVFGLGLARNLEKNGLVHAVIFGTLESVFFLLGHAIDAEYGLSWGAVLIFALNFLLVISAL